MPCHLLLLVVIHLPASHTHTHTFTRTVTHNKTHTQYIYIHTHSHHTRTRTTARVPTVTEEVLSGPRNTLVAAPRYSHPNPRQAEAPVALTCTVTAAAGPTRPGGLTRAWSPATTSTGPRPPPASAPPASGEHKLVIQRFSRRGHPRSARTRTRAWDRRAQPLLLSRCWHPSSPPAL